MENNCSDNGLKSLKLLLQKASITCPQWQSQSICDEFRFKSNTYISDQFDKLTSNLDQTFNNHEMEREEIDEKISPPFDIVINDILGRYLVTTRDIKAGEALLVEKCIASGPIVHIPNQNKIPLCVQCYTEARTYLCPRCGFFLCLKDVCKKLHTSKRECQLLSKLDLVKNEVHIHDLEENDLKSILQHLPLDECNGRCQTIPEAQIKFVDEQKTKILKYYPALPTLKTLCIIEKSEMAERIVFSLQGDIKPGSRRYKINQKHIVDIIKLMTTYYNEENLHRLAAIWDTNAFQSNEKERKIQVLFTLASFFTHSCKPNCENFLSKGSDTMIVRAVEFIPKNTVLTINYADPLWPTYIRRDHLKVSKKFLCNCERCEDSTEYGTYMGHIICDSCNQLTLSTSNSNNCNILTCSNCRMEMKYSKILADEATICNVLSNIQIVNFEIYEKISSKIATVFGTKFHRGHHILWKMRFSLVVDHAEQNLSDIDNEKLLKIAGIIFDLYKFCSSTLPTYSKKKACVSKELLRYSEELLKRTGKPFLDEKDMKIIEEESKLPLSW